MTGESLESLPIGHYAVAVTADGEEIDIYRASGSEIWNVATGKPVVSLSSWRRPDRSVVRPNVSDLTELPGSA